MNPPNPWHLGHHQANPYFAFTDHCNRSQLRVILASGQACVWYRLALASKDGDWIIRETVADCQAVLQELAALGAHYRLGAPLDPRWLAAGWSSHFEAIDAQGLRLRFDFVSRPPRITPAQLSAMWARVESGAPAVVEPPELIRLKQTMRLKDYPFIGSLATQLPDPEDMLRWCLDAESLLELLKQHPDLIQRLAEIRPALSQAATTRNAPDAVEVMGAAIDAEIRTLRAADERRIRAYARAIEPWASSFRQLDSSALPLLDAHQQLMRAATGVLSEEPPCPIP